MKTVLRMALLFVMLNFAVVKANAQCTVSNIVIQNVSVVSQSGSSCTVRFDASFNILNNNGNKYIFIHAWLQSDYPNYFHCVNGQSTLNGSIHAPDSSDLGNVFLTIGIDNTGASPVLLSTYIPDPTVPVTTVATVQSEVLPDGSANIIMTGITTTLPTACGVPVVVVADLWSSQSAHAQVAHCVNCGIMYSAGFLSTTGFVNCANLTYNATITNNTATPISGFYRIYADINMDGYFTPASDTLIRDTTSFSITAGPGSTTSVSGPVPPANRNQDMFLVLTQTSGQASGASRVTLLHSTQCASLPVSFGAFTAKRISSSTVYLQWQTLSEINNNGFAVERDMGDGIWNRVGFVPTQSTNSNIILNYSFTDPNNNRNITQYRLRQVDIDSRIKYSEIRIARGNGQTSDLLVYPNPSFNSMVNVIFDDKESVRDIIVLDGYGRNVQHWNNFGANTLQISDLQAGAYILRVKNRADGSQTTTKFVILGRK